MHLDDIIGLFGETRHSNALVTRLVVRSLLPRKHGGVDAEKVIVIDADNSSSPYLYVDFARRYGMHYKSVLHKVLCQTIYNISTYPYNNLRFTKESTVIQAEGTSDIWFIRSILSRSLHQYC
ncbi:MAG: hypothetical protein ACHQXG_02970 [Nitrososphaerales archaeon]